MLCCKSKRWGAVLIILTRFQSSAGRNISGPFEEVINNVDHGSCSLFGKYSHQGRGERSAFRAIPHNRALWNGHPWFFNTGKTEIQQLNPSASSSTSKNTTPSYVLRVSWNQRHLQICQYRGLPACVCRRNSGKFSLILVNKYILIKRHVDL